MFLLIPLWKKLGVNIIYLLPITKSGEHYKKGEAPTPYAVKNFFQIDPNLYDPMLGEFSEKKLNLLFKAFVECCHHFDIKVLLDFIPRTAARDNDLVLEHPDWFYWIKKDYENIFTPPYIYSLGFRSYEKKIQKALYTAIETRKFLEQFTLPPNKIDSK